MTRTRIASALLACVCAASLGACGGGDDKPSSSSASSGGLTLKLVEEKTAPAFKGDPNCPVGKWDDNSTGVDEGLRSAVAEFKQFDCYKQESDIGGFPARGQQSIFVSFKDEATATKYAKSQQALYPSLQDGKTVVVAGSGLESVDMPAYLNDLKAACGCGEVRTPPTRWARTSSVPPCRSSRRCGHSSSWEWTTSCSTAAASRS